MPAQKTGIWLTLTVTLTLCSHTKARVAEHESVIGQPAAKGQFTSLREPSGVTAMDKHTLIVIEDEARRALRRLRVDSSNASMFSFEEFEQPTAKGFIQRQLLAPLDDLEGIARVSDNRFFIIGSHENASRGAHPAREKIVMLTRDGDDIVSADLRRDLFDQLSQHYPELAKIVDGSRKGKRRALNIEALAFDRKRQQLLIGLRTPLLDDNAIIISLRNPINYIEGSEPEFTDSMHGIDLDGDGIRAMAYDDRSDTLLVISKPETGGKNRSRLWTLVPTMNQDPVRYKSADKDLFKDVEGLTPFGNGVFFVRDNGGSSRQNDDDQWFILERPQLRLDNK
ncbi:MAG: DUF3616 domain-containing protein [Granulosicoccus sp.]